MNPVDVSVAKSRLIWISKNGVMTGGLAALGLHLDPINCIWFIYFIFFVCKIVDWKDLMRKVWSQRFLSFHFRILCVLVLVFHPEQLCPWRGHPMWQCVSVILMFPLAPEWSPWFDEVWCVWSGWQRDSTFSSRTERRLTASVSLSSGLLTEWEVDCKKEKYHWHLCMGISSFFPQRLQLQINSLIWN